ncbi:MAG: hypothetical protein Q8928_05575 [Bacteroidota bacterium]|nr:hypothetical protein [Bacteroidota bacterium]
MGKSEKMTKIEKLTLVISSIALILTSIQLLFSIPFVSNLFYSAKIIGARIDDKYSNREYETTFLIKNEGNKNADNLMVNLTIPKESKLTIVPNVLYEIEAHKNGEPLKDIIIKCPHFLPKENIYIIVNTDSSNYYKFKNENDTIRFPMLGIIKYDDGFGKTERQ